jgi:epoxyqueuosine reductase
MPEKTGSAGELSAAALERLRARAEGLGLLRLGAVGLDHAGFAPAVAAYEAFLRGGKAGEMGFLERTRAVRADPSLMLPGARSLLVACVPYAGEAGPIARYAQGRDYHTELHGRLLALATALAEEAPGAASIVCVDTKPVLERSAAYLAGLGFLGKNGLLIVPGLGSYVLIGALLTTASLADETGPWRHVDAAAIPWDSCGECSRCLEACPTQAFDGPGALDPRRCVSYLTIEHRGPISATLAAGIGERIAGCDVCQEVCPYNASAARLSRIPAGALLPQLAGGPRRVSALELTGIGNARHRALGRGSALRRIPRRSLRRNALIALGNRPGAASEEEREALARGLLDEDPQIVWAAAWAGRRRGLDVASLRAGGAGSASPARAAATDGADEDPDDEAPL